MAKSAVLAARGAQGQDAKARMVERLRAKRPVTATYDVVIDPEPLKALREAESTLDLRKRFAPDKDKDDAGHAAYIKDQLDAFLAAEEQAQGAVETLHLQALPRDAYEAFLGLHPPTDEQKARDELYDVDTFLPALIAGTVVPDSERAPDPTLRDLDGYDADTVLPGRVMSARDAAEVLESWNQGEVHTLWQIATSVCTQVRSVGLPFGSARTHG